MIKSRAIRHLVAALLMAGGAMLIFLAPPIWIGAIPLALGMLVETVGIMIEHQRGPASNNAGVAH